MKTFDSVIKRVYEAGWKDAVAASGEPFDEAEQQMMERFFYGWREKLGDPTEDRSSASGEEDRQAWHDYLTTN